MLFLLSPAKSLDYDTPVPEGLPHTTPQFVPQSTALIDVLREQSPQQIASLMELSDTLAALNVARYQAWRPRAADHLRRNTRRSGVEAAGAKAYPSRSNPSSWCGVAMRCVMA